jgi:hypothetical protein
MGAGDEKEREGEMVNNKEKEYMDWSLTVH